MQLVAEALEQNPRFDEVLSICFPEEFKAVRDAVAAGGVKEFDLEDPKELHAACRMPELVGLGMLFVSGTKASFALSDLFMSQAPSLDWDGIEARVQQGQRIFDHIGAAVYLRGIMLALDANDEFGEGLSGNEVIDIIARYMQAGYAGFAIMSFEEDPDELYLVDGSLCDSCYPPENRSLLERILDEGGCVLSEHAPGAHTRAYHFARRNRIISGLSQAVIVVEAGEKSGALITAQYALAQHRELFAVPGSIYAQACRGSNRLLVADAHVALSAEEVFSAMSWLSASPEKQAEEPVELDPQSRRVVEFLQNDEKSFDEIVNELQIEAWELNSLLTILEMQGIIRQSAGKLYRSLI